MYKKLNAEEDKELLNIISRLKELYPTARPRLIEVFFRCLAVHAQKNNDYNGDMDLYRATGVVGRFCDVWRKVIRLYNALILKTDMVVNENLIETVQDSIVYHALLVEELEDVNNVTVKLKVNSISYEKK